jgi:DNA-binding transcriptional ArsR family regulator
MVAMHPPPPDPNKIPDYHTLFKIYNGQSLPFVDASLIFKALAVPVRVRIVKLLQCTREVSVGEMAEVFGVSQPEISRQLTPLLKLCFVARRKVHPRTYYRLRRDRSDIHNKIINIIHNVVDRSNPNGDCRRLKLLRSSKRGSAT